jgi:D-3-phosphoglycerate dehydrogenase / 2-oxoglutarate reductase
MSASPDGVVTVTDSAELLAPAIERLHEAGTTVHVLPDGTAPLDAAEAAADSTVVIDGVLRFGADEIARLRDTRLIVRAGIGVDLIDVRAATARGIWVANVPDYCVDEVADHTLLLLLAATRRLDALAGTWRRERRWLVYDLLPEVHRPSERVLGIVGLGRIGSAVARRAASFGWRVIGHDAALPAEAVRARGAEPVGLDELFASAHAITLHCPLTAETHHLVDGGRLASAQRGLIVVNTSRGGLVDIDALGSALETGQVAAAALDVLEDEPSPDLSRPILARPNVTITSHVAWYSAEARRELALLCADEALRVLEGGRPRNAVNPEARA